MLGQIIGVVVVGAVVGALARLITKIGRASCRERV